jgi:IclR family acetate operon transcriptional repressor
VQPVIRALRTVRTVARAERGLSLQDLSDELDIPIGSMHRLLAVLSGEGFLARSPTTRRYFLGPAARELVGVSADGGLVRPHEALRHAAEATGESVFLAELVGNRAVCVALVEGIHPLRLFVRIGQEMPLHAAASARVLLCDLHEDVVRLLLSRTSMTPYTRDTPRTVGDVLEHLQMVRARGYDVCDDELDDGVWAVSAPVRTSTGRVRASVTMAAPRTRMAETAAREAATRTVVEAADAMAADLGFDARTGSADVPTAPRPTIPADPRSPRA